MRWTECLCLIDCKSTTGWRIFMWPVSTLRSTRKETQSRLARVSWSTSRPVCFWKTKSLMPSTKATSMIVALRSLRRCLFKTHIATNRWICTPTFCTSRNATENSLILPSTYIKMKSTGLKPAALSVTSTLCEATITRRWSTFSELWSLIGSTWQLGPWWATSTWKWKTRMRRLKATGQQSIWTRRTLEPGTV